MVCRLLLLLAALTTAGLAESWQKSGDYAIAYVGTCGKEEGICLMYSDGSQRRLIVPRGVEPPLLEPHGWSPDGRKLVYYDGRAHLVSIEEHRDEELPVPLIGLDIQLVWSPDSTRIAFASPVEAPNWKDPEVQRGHKVYSTAIYVIDVRTKKMSRLTSFGQNRWISWSPDGRQIVFSGSESGEAKSSIYAVDTAGENHPRRIFSGSTINVFPIWSPQGDQIAFAAAPMPGKEMSDAGVYVIRPDGSAPRRIWPVQSSADWSPDGRFLLIASHVVNVENGATVDLGGLGEGTFSPDGRSIIYARDSEHGRGSDQGKGSIGTIDMDGKNRRSLLEVCSFSCAAYSRYFAVSPLLRHQNAELPPRVFHFLGTAKDDACTRRHPVCPKTGAGCFCWSRARWIHIAVGGLRPGAEFTLSPPLLSSGGA